MCSRFEIRACLYVPEDVLVERGDGRKRQRKPNIRGHGAGTQARKRKLEGDRGLGEVSSSMMLSCG